jgi:L-lactate dehydrogenase complex protein LldE
VSAAPGRIQLFVTCLVDALRPAVGWATVRVLSRLGYEVAVPEGQTCCGQPAYNAGEWGEARAMAERTLSVLERSPDPVVLASGSCVDMIVHGYAELFRDDDVLKARARAVASRTRELSQLLGEGPALAARSAGSVTYHPPCHLLRGLGQRGGPERLLDSVTGLERTPLPAAEECCGFGGLFSVKLGGVSSAMLKRKLDAIESTGAESVVSCDLSCLTQIEGGLRRRGSKVRARHLAEVLAEGLAEE